jgi:hypothetical protein
MHTPEQVLENIASIKEVISSEFWQELKKRTPD